jgi:hypothetical protein
VGVFVEISGHHLKEKHSLKRGLKRGMARKKAAIAVAASILTTVYHMLRDGTCYQDLGPEYLTRRNLAKAAARLANRIRNLGYHVEIRPAA